MNTPSKNAPVKNLPQMNTIITDYLSQEVAIRQIRDEVFVIEQKVDRDEEFDDRDAHCMHALVWMGNLPIATGRIDLAKNGKVGRVAVLKSHRKIGAGRAIMIALEEYACANNAAEAWFHAQTHAIPFYEKLGYTVCSEEFMEANIPHVKMQKPLSGA